MAPAVGKHKEQLIWFTADARFVAGDRLKPGAAPQWSLGRVLNGLPAQGFWGSMVYSDSTAPPSSTEAARTIVAGLVRGPVTRVMVNLPGGPVSAHLKPASLLGLGTICWVVTDAFDGSGKVVPAHADPAFGTDSSSITLTAYRGDRPVFYCRPLVQGDGTG